MTIRPVHILSTGSYVPERVVTNTEVDALIGEPTGEWLIANVGIRDAARSSARLLCRFVEGDEGDD